MKRNYGANIVIESRLSVRKKIATDARVFTEKGTAKSVKICASVAKKNS